MTLISLLLVLMVIKLIAYLFLEWVNIKYLNENAADLPDSLKGIMDEATFNKSVEYTQAKTQFMVVNALYDAVILGLILVLGILPFIYERLSAFLGDGIFSQALVFIISMFIISLPTLPFSWWSAFKLEEAFGFNKSTIGLWVSDQVKGFALSIILGVPLIAGLIWIVNQMGDFWWVWAFVFFWLFQVIMLVLYPMFILPLFNKLEPLGAGELKDRLLALGDRCGFKSKTIYVMDGSKRSGHSNAFFTGFGKFRRIVLYDTLIEQMETEELEAVLAHEIGHYKCGHIPKRLCFSAFSTFLLFALVGWLMQATWIFDALSFAPEIANTFIPAFLIISLFGSLFTFWFSPIDSLWSRKQEYEADAFAREAMDGPNSLKQALRKLYKENLSNLIPHPFYSAFYYSHPTLVEREYSLMNE